MHENGVNFLFYSKIKSRGRETSVVVIQNTVNYHMSMSAKGSKKDRINAIFYTHSVRVKLWLLKKSYLLYCDLIQTLLYYKLFLFFYSLVLEFLKLFEITPLALILSDSDDKTILSTHILYIKRLEITVESRILLMEHQ